MSMKELLSSIRGLDAVVELAPTEGSDFPPIAWGDHFFYYSPSGEIPQQGQPFATIVTKNYPDDTASDLDPDGRWRLNLHIGRARYTELIGEDPRHPPAVDVSQPDVVLPHPTYHALGWVCLVNPTSPTAVGLVREAYEGARARDARRASADPAPNHERSVDNPAEP